MVTQGNIKSYFFNPLLDRCPVSVTATSGDVVTLTTTNKTGGYAAGAVEETRTAYSGKAEFDLSAYYRTNIDTEMVLPAFLTSKSTTLWPLAAAAIHYYKQKVTEADGTETELQSLPLLASVGPGESMLSRRYHYYNPNFPNRTSFLYLVSTVVKVDGTQTSGGLKNCKVCAISDTLFFVAGYWDNIGDSKTHQFTMTASNQVDPAKETSVTSLDDMTVAGWVGTREDVYLWDCKTEGVCLRFLDRYGMAQTLVLDKASTDRTTSDTIRKAYGKSDNRVNSYGFVYGDGSRADKEVADVIHSGLESAPEELYGDLCDLACSPCVMMYENGLWQRVRVTAGTITRNERKHSLTADVDVYPISKNTLR